MRKDSTVLAEIKHTLDFIKIDNHRPPLALRIARTLFFVGKVKIDARGAPVSTNVRVESAFSQNCSLSWPFGLQQRLGGLRPLSAH